MESWCSPTGCSQGHSEDGVEMAAVAMLQIWHEPQPVGHESLCPCSILHVGCGWALVVDQVEWVGPEALVGMVVVVKVVVVVVLVQEREVVAPALVRGAFHRHASSCRKSSR